MWLCYLARLRSAIRGDLSSGGGASPDVLVPPDPDPDPDPVPSFFTPLPHRGLIPSVPDIDAPLGRPLLAALARVYILLREVMTRWKPGRCDASCVIESE